MRYIDFYNKFIKHAITPTLRRGDIGRISKSPLIRKNDVTMSHNVHLFPISIYGTERLTAICLPEEQLQYVRFSAAAAQYEAAGNPWCFAVDMDGRCIGYLAAESDSDGDLHINKFVIDYSYQRQGAGTAAMEEFLRMARDSDANFIFLSVAYGNPAAARFYRRFGFVDTELGMAEAGCKLMTLSLR